MTEVVITKAMFGDLMIKDWFALASGLASIFSLIYALYQSRIKHQPQSKLRALEWTKALLISFGTGLVITGGIGFYNQSLPPHTFRDFYDYIHGYEGSHWTESHYPFTTQFDISAEPDDLTIDITQLELTNDNTRVYFRATPLIHPELQGLTTTTEPYVDPLSYVIIGTTTGLRYHLKDQQIQKNKSGAITGYWEFPSLLNRSGDILLWLGKTEFSEATIGTATVRLNIDDRGSGTSVWGPLFIAGIVILVLGFIYNPFNSLRKRLLTEGKKLQNEQSRELAKILKNRTSEELSVNEKEEYDRVSRFYKRAEEVIFKALMGDYPESLKESNKADGSTQRNISA